MHLGLLLKVESHAAVQWLTDCLLSTQQHLCRAPAAADVVLEHLSVSRQHAQLTVDLTGVCLIMDLGSAHGTKLNDAWLKSQQQRTLNVGGSVQFGASTRKYKLLGVQKL